MIAYKGFNKDMTCRDFQYEEGKKYETEKAIICKEGFHACKYPLDCFYYYAPNKSVYHIVEQDGEITEENQNDSKVASTKIKIGAKLDIAGLVKAAIEYTKEKVNPEAKSDRDYGASSAIGYKGASSVTGDYGASSATGYKGASVATGYKGVSSATGDCGASVVTGDYGASVTTGYYGASSAIGDYGASVTTGDYGASVTTGDYGASSATGYRGASVATGYKGVSSATGDCGASSATGYKGASETTNSNAIAVAWGYHGKAKGVLGSYIVLADWEGNEDKWYDPLEWTLKEAKMFKVDGIKIKENTWYTLLNGELVEVENED